MTKPLPEFETPPLVEVALAVEFEKLPDFRTPHVGLLWNEFKAQYPQIEEHAPIESQLERFGIPAGGRPQVQIEMIDKPPIPRCWFLNESGSELIQIQQDRFIHNWRKIGEGDEYPRYEHIRENFSSDLDRFAKFLEREELGVFNPIQCEVTYVNHIVADSHWKDHSELHKVLTVIDERYTDKFLPKCERLCCNGSYIIPTLEGNPLGRLHFSVEPGVRALDNQAIFQFKLIARGRPVADGMAGVLGFLDIGREWIVRGFAALTEHELQSNWGRQQ